MEEIGMYTVTCDYLATGEGLTYMVLFTRGYGSNADRRVNALQTFARHFGDYMVTGATVSNGLKFEFPGHQLLLTDVLKEKLLDWANDAGGLEYHASIHVNFS